MADKLDVDVLWAIAAEESLLERVEEFLLHAGEPELQANLDKFRQDIGLDLADIMADPDPTNFQADDELCHLKGAFDLDVNPVEIHNPAPILNHEPVTLERLGLLTDVGQALEVHGAEMYQEFTRFVANVQSVAVPVSSPVAIPPGLAI